MTKHEAKIAYKDGVSIQYTGGQLSIGKWTDIVIDNWNFDKPGGVRFRYREKPTYESPK